MKSPSRSQYFFGHYGWADLLAIVPFPAFKLFRIIRLVKSYTLINRIGPKGTLRQLLMSKASGALYLIFFLIILLLEFGSIAVLSAEKSNPAANIKDANDAIWWVYMTIATVGYGDLYPTTTAGRLLGALVMTVGVGLFAVLTGYLANRFLPTGESGSVYIGPEHAVSSLASVQADLDDIKDKLEQLTNQLEQAVNQKR